MASDYCIGMALEGSGRAPEVLRVRHCFGWDGKQELIVHVRFVIP